MACSGANHKSYYYESVGHISKDTVQRNIELQKYR